MDSFVHIEYLPVADNTVVTGDASAITQAGKLVALDDTGKINRYFIPYSDLSVTSIRAEDGTPLTGDVRLYGKGSITVLRSGNDLYFDTNFAQGVTGITVGSTTLTGNILFVAGSGLEITSNPVTHTIQFSNIGVTSLNGLKEDIVFESSEGVVVTQRDASTLAFEVRNLSWSQFDTSSLASAKSLVLQEGIYLGDAPYQSIYGFNNQTVIRGISGVHIPDPVTLSDVHLSEGNGIYLNDSRIQDISGVLYLSPASGAVVFSSGTSLLNIEAIQPSYASGAYLTKDISSGLYLHTFDHSTNLSPLSLLVTEVLDPLSADPVESTNGFGANLSNDYGYNVTFTRNAITVQARYVSDPATPPFFKVRCLFAAEDSIAPLTPEVTVTSAPIQPSVSLVGVPTGGGFPSDILVPSRPVANATGYEWSRPSEPYTWQTVTPLLSTQTTTGSFLVSRPGKFYHTVRAFNSTGYGPSTGFYITVRPASPVLDGPVYDIQDMGVYFYKKAKITLTYQSGFVSVTDLITGQEMALESPISYSPPATSLGSLPPVISVPITLINLFPNTVYRLVAKAYIDSEIYSDTSTPLEIYIPS